MELLSLNTTRKISPHVYILLFALPICTSDLSSCSQLLQDEDATSIFELSSKTRTNFSYVAGGVVQLSKGIAGQNVEQTADGGGELRLVDVASGPQINKRCLLLISC